MSLVLLERIIRTYENLVCGVRPNVRNSFLLTIVIQERYRLVTVAVMRKTTKLSEDSFAKVVKSSFSRDFQTKDKIPIIELCHFL